MAKINLSFSLNISIMDCTIFLLADLLTGVPPTALKIKPKGGLKRVCFPIKLISLALANLDKTAIGKSQFEVCGAAMIIYLSIWEGKSLGTFHPRRLNNINLEILCIPAILGYFFVIS
jgi:hypothetical protein